MDESIDLLFELREALEEHRGISVSLMTRIVNHTNDYVGRSKLRPTGAAHRDRLVEARCNMRAE